MFGCYMKKSILLEILIIISSIYGVFITADNGFMSVEKFLYYTIQSNIFILIICAIFLIFKLSKKKIPNYLYVIKYICTVGISITFLVFAFILVPQLGLTSMNYLLSPSNMSVHLISPILAIIDFMLYDKIKMTKNTYLSSCLMPVIYATIIIGMSFITDAALFGSMASGQMQRFPYFFMDYETNGWFTLTKDFTRLGAFYWVIIIWGLALLLGKLFLKVNQKNGTKKNRYITIIVIIAIAIISTLWPLLLN